MAKKRAARIDPTRLSLPDAAKLLRVTVPVLRTHLESGAPANPDGTLNLVHFTAWLHKEASARGI